MDLYPSDDQRALGAATRSLLENHCDPMSLRAMVDGDERRRALWSRLADSGLFSMCLAEDEGGAGLDLADATLVFEELGRAAAPGPLLWTHLSAGVVDGAAVGDAAVSGVWRDDRPWVVEHPGDIAMLVVIDNDGAWLVRTADIDVQSTSVPLDPLVPITVLSALPQGDQIADRAGVEWWSARGAVLAAAMLAGLASSATDLATTYAKERRQFRRPIGSFQAIKHILADDLVGAVTAQAAVHAAATLVDTADPKAPLDSVTWRAVHAAKICAGEAAVRATKDCIQVHGGIGFTSEAHPHLLAKRAQVLESCFGSTDHHALALSELLR